MSPRLRRVLLSLHLYLGLLMAPYLLVYGVSTWLLNRDGPAEDAAPAHTWSAAVDVTPAPDDRATAERVRDALGLFGHVPPWRVEAGEDALRFVVSRPGRLYHLRYAPAEGRVEVETLDKGLGAVLKGLHGLHVLPGSRWVASWALYTELSVVALGLMVVSGLWLDARRWRRRPGAALGLAAAIACTGLLAGWMVAP